MNNEHVDILEESEQKKISSSLNKTLPFEIICEIIPEYCNIEEIITQFLLKYPSGCLSASKCEQTISNKSSGSEIKCTGVMFVCDNGLIFSSVFPHQTETLHELNSIEQITIEGKKLIINEKIQIVTYEFNSKSNNVLSLVASFFKDDENTIRINNDFIKPNKFKVVMLTIGSRGDVQPFVCLALEMMARGYSVKIVTHSCFREFIESYDIEFHPLSCDPKDLLKLCVENTMFSVNFVRESFEAFVSKIPTLLNEAWEGCRDANILISTPTALAGYHIAEKLKIRFYNAFTMPYTNTSDQANIMMAMSVKPNNTQQNGWYTSAYNIISNFITDQAMWTTVRKAINRWRRDVLRLPNKGYLESNNTIFNTQKIITLYCYSPSISPKHPEWNEHIHVTGYWRTKLNSHYKPDPELIKFIKKFNTTNDQNKTEKRCVLVTFGSIPIPNADEIYNMFINSGKLVSETKPHGLIICTGWSKSKLSSSENVYVCDELPFDLIVPHTKIVCHHGGAGTTATCLVHKKPTIVVPFFGDQYYWGKCIQDLQIGKVVPYRELTQEIVYDMFREMLLHDDPPCFRKAREIGNIVEAETKNGIANAINIIESNSNNAYIPPTFIPDGESLRCANIECDKQFGYLVGKHHCRNCGGCFCHDCCKTKLPIPKFRYDKPERVCINCKNILSNKNLIGL